MVQGVEGAGAGNECRGRMAEGARGGRRVRCGSRGERREVMSEPGEGKENWEIGRGGVLMGADGGGMKKIRNERGMEGVIALIPCGRLKLYSIMLGIYPIKYTFNGLYKINATAMPTQNIPNRDNLNMISYLTIEERISQ